MKCVMCDGSGLVTREASKVDGIDYPETEVDCEECSGEGEVCDECGQPYFDCECGDDEDDEDDDEDEDVSDDEDCTDDELSDDEDE